MSLSSKLAGLVLILFFFSQNSFGQYSDFKTWGALSFSKELSSDFKAELEFGQRLKENSARYDRSLITGSLQYKLYKDLKLKFGYRYLFVQNKDLQIESRYRINGDLSWKYNFGDFSLRLRERIQYGFDELADLDEALVNKVTSRSKIGLDYSIFGTPITAHSSYEHFLLLNDPGVIYTSDHRIKIGASYALNSRMDLDLSYLFNQEINKANPVSAHIVFVGLSYEL